jgi:pyridinium-3,5-bisthiocarboxylic acid mononucleotide nickel chelatase
VITYLDLGAGIAGDMLLGALIGLGVSRAELSKALQRAIPLKGWSLEINSVERHMWPAQTVRVRGDRPFTSQEKMFSIIRKAELPQPVRRRALAVLTSLREAEKAAHGHAHDSFDPKGLGRIDTLVDVIGTSWCLWRLNIRDAFASELNTGRIAPATGVLIRRAKIPVYTKNSSHELATPTGVAILSHLVKRFRPLPVTQIHKTGYGAGALKLSDRPNVLVIYQGKTTKKID